MRDWVRSCFIGVGGGACVAVALLLGSEGCSSFDGGPTSDGATPDAASLAPDADGGSPGPGPDAADGGTFCGRLSAKPRVCVDFEDGKALTASFPVTTGNVVLVADGGYESAHALHAAAEVGQGAGAGRPVGPPLAKSQSLAFQVRTPAGAASAVSSRLDLSANGGLVCRFEVRLSATSATLWTFINGVASPKQYTLLGHPGPDRWFRVEVRIAAGSSGDSGAAQVLAHVRIDGVEALPQVELVTDCDSAVMKTAQQFIELGAQSPDSATQLSFDDIVFDGQ